MIALLALVAMAGAGGFSQTGQPAAPSPAVASAQSSSPSFQPLRYEEDWSYLKDASKRSEWIDTLKYIPVNRKGWYVSLGGESRLRYEYFDQFNFGAGAQDENGYLFTTLLNTRRFSFWRPSPRLYAATKRH
jgi:hypothetical protein